MKKLSILLFIIGLLFITGCASTCMEYRSATTAARSEKNMKRAEEWALKALESAECNPTTDAHTPYFLATEVYLLQKNYGKMAKMLEIAEKRNPDQLLEHPFKLGDQSVETISEGVSAYRDQEWTKIYNKAINYIQKANTNNNEVDEKRILKAQKQLELAILINPQKGENYLTLAAIQTQNNDIDAALTTVNRGLDADDKNSERNCSN